MTDNRRLWPLVANEMPTDSLAQLDATLTEWAGVPLHDATMDDLAHALRSLELFHDAAVTVYAEKLAGAGMHELENHANGGRP